MGGELTSWMYEKMAERGLSMNRLARESGVSCTYVWQILHRKANPSSRIVRKLAAGLGVAADDVLEMAGCVPGDERQGPEGGDGDSWKAIEYWRSRIVPGIVYWRPRTDYYTAPESGTPSELARILLRLRRSYGPPQRETYDGLHGPVTVWWFETERRFYVSTLNRRYRSEVYS